MVDLFTMKGLYKMSGSRFWWFRYSQGGKRHAVSLKTDDESTAITKARAILAEGLLLNVPSSLHVDALITQYLRVAQERSKKPLRPEVAKTRRYILNKYANETGIESVGQITHDSFSSWITHLKAVGDSADTIHTYARVIKTFVRWLEDNKLARRGLYSELEIPAIPPSGRKSWLKSDVCARIIANAQDHDLRFILYCGIHAGLRRAEISEARVGWFDLDAGLIHIQNGPGFVLKDKENRVVPLTKEFNQFLCDFLRNRNPVDFAIAPNKVKGAWRYRYDFSKVFKSHVSRLGVKCTIHDMRRSFASNLVSHGVSIYKVARWLGDGVQVVEQSYGHLAPSDDEINKVQAQTQRLPVRR